MHPRTAYPTVTRAVALFTLVALLTACATTQLPPISATGAAFEPLQDERNLWAAARAEEERLLGEVRVYQDPLLVDYLEDLVAGITPPTMVANPEVRYRVTVIEDPTLNAFAYPHGSIYLHTGLLARMENEAQLATVLGHETTHVENRHMIRHSRAARNRQIGFTALAVTAAVVVAGETGEAIEEGNYSRAAQIDVLSDVLIGLGLTLAFVAAVNGYGRALEDEADEGAFAKLAAAGYDPAEAPKVYEALMEDRGDPGKVEAFFFGSHPRLAARITNAQAWVAGHPGEVAEPTLGDEDRFARRIRPVVRDDARLNLELGRLEIAEGELEKVLDWMPEDPEAWRLRAELRLAQADLERDPAIQEVLRGEAKDALHEAIRLDPDRPAPHRDLGLVLYRDGDFRGACRELRHYLETAPPDAEDADRVRDYVLELEQEEWCAGAGGAEVGEGD